LAEAIQLGGNFRVAVSESRCMPVCAATAAFGLEENVADSENRLVEFAPRSD
jgi:hypothetical protein